MNSSAQNAQIIKRYKSPLAFYALSIAIPWSLWFISGYFSHIEPYTRAIELATGISSFAGLLAPIIIALFFILPDTELRKDFIGRFFNFNGVRLKYMLIALFLMLFSILAAQAISLLLGYSISQFELRGAYTFTSAIFWAFWHFPLSFIKDYYHSNLVESGLIYSINFVVSLIPFVFIMNWLYYKTNRNILLPVVFHITAGFFNEIFCTHPMSKVIQTGLLLIVSAFLVIRDKDLFFKYI